MRGVVFRDQTDRQTTDGSHGHTHRGLRWRQMQDGITDGRRQIERGGKVVHRGKVDRWDHHDGRTDQLDLQGPFDVGFTFDGPDVSGDERTQQADEDPDSGHHHGEYHRIPTTRQTDTTAQD